MMDENSIRKYAQLMKELDLTGLEITEDNVSVRLERGTAPVQTVVQAAVPQVGPAPVQSSAGTGDITVKSPMVGVFYSAPAENAQPFVQVGDKVHKGDTLCIIEAMKLMNEITAEEDGTVTEICVGNGQVVEFGTVLFCMARG